MGEGIDQNNYVLKIHRYVYSKKVSGRVWNQYLTKKLIQKIGFKESKVNECVFYKGNTIYLLYIDDSILAGPDVKEINLIIKDMRKAKLQITEEDIQDFLGVHINQRVDVNIELTQPHLIQQILEDLRLDKDDASAKVVPATLSKILRSHLESEDFDGSFDYRSIIGKSNYLQKGSRSDIAYITHQCARFTTNPKKEHKNAVRWLGRYLKQTADKGTILIPSRLKGLEVYVDADFSGNWYKEDLLERDSARSRHGYFIIYGGYPIT